MRHGIVLFTSDRGITPAALGRAAEERGFATLYVPEHTHIPVRRTAAHPGTGDETLPDDRYTAHPRPVGLAGHGRGGHRADRAGHRGRAAGRVRPDHAGQADRHPRPPLRRPGHAGRRVRLEHRRARGPPRPAARRRTVLKEYVEAMRALWTQEEASYDGEHVSFGPSWAYPKPVGRVPLVIGAGGGPKTFALDRRARRRVDDHPAADRHQRSHRGAEEGLGRGRAQRATRHPGADRVPPRPRRPGRLGRPPGSPS